MKLYFFVLLILGVRLFGHFDEQGFPIIVNIVSNEGWGLKAGTNITDIYDSYTRNDEKNNSQIGLKVSYFLSRSFYTSRYFHFYADFELQYFLRSWQNVIENDLIYNKSKVRIHSISLPVLIKNRLNYDPKINAFVYVGLNPGFIINAYTDFENIDHTTGDKDSGSENIYDNVNLFELSIIMGAELAYKFNRSNIILDIEYEYGLTDIMQSNKISKYLRTWKFSIGYQFAVIYVQI